jgi:excisionase family DNA binding protein
MDHSDFHRPVPRSAAFLIVFPVISVSRRLERQIADCKGNRITYIISMTYYQSGETRLAKVKDPAAAPRAAFSPAEIAERLGLSEAAVLRACRSGVIRSVRIGRRILIPASEPQRLLAAAAAREG